MLNVNWMIGRLKINKLRFRAEVHKKHNLLDQTDIMLLNDHLDLFNFLVGLEWRGRKSYTHKAREDRLGMDFPLRKELGLFVSIWLVELVMKMTRTSRIRLVLGGFYRLLKRLAIKVVCCGRQWLRLIVSWMMSVQSQRPN